MPSRFVHRLAVRVVAVVLLLAIGLAAGVWWKQPRFVEEEIRQLVVTTVQQESPASFYVTGALDIAATVTVENTKYLFPELLRFNLGTTRSIVRIPGRVSYGFDVTQLRPEDIRIQPDGLIEVTIPRLRLYSVEPALENMEVETSVGWARLQTSSGRRVEQKALGHVREALEAQGTKHLQDSTQPRVNTANAMEALLTPVLKAAGIPDPKFRFEIGTGLVMKPPG